MSLPKQTTAMRLASGEEVHYADPSRTKIHTSDLYQGLKNTCRYGGQIEVCVLAHLCLCVRLAEYHKGTGEQIAYVAAHDLQEGITLCDIPQGLKCLLPNYSKIEALWEAHIHESLGLNWPPSDEVVDFVKYIDLRSLVVETTIYGWGDWQPLVDLAGHVGGPAKPGEISTGREVLGSYSPELQWHVVTKAITNYRGSHQ